jgi:hypothetical protein
MMLAPFLNVVPSTDGTSLFISASGTGQLGGTVSANVSIGGGSRKGHTMTYSDTIQGYVTTQIDPVIGLTPNQNESGDMSITTTLGLASELVQFNRAYIPASTTQDINSIDGNLQLAVVNTDTIDFDTYVVVVPSYGPPGPPPQGHRFVGSVYSARAAGTRLTSDKPMILELAYSNLTLAEADPHTLAIFFWDAFNEQWIDRGGTLFPAQKFVSIATSDFATYALMATPTWRDGFDELSGLDLTQLNNITLGGTPGNRTLILLNSPGSGSAVSQPITPTNAITGWDSLIFTSTVTSPNTTLTVDVLSIDGAEVLTNVASGASLAAIDPAQYPSLRLRVNMASTAAGQTPVLDEWQLNWQGAEYKTYLPVVLKGVSY